MATKKKNKKTAVENAHHVKPRCAAIAEDTGKRCSWSGKEAVEGKLYCGNHARIMRTRLKPVMSVSGKVGFVKEDRGRFPPSHGAVLGVAMGDSEFIAEKNMHVVTVRVGDQGDKVKLEAAGEIKAGELLASDADWRVVPVTVAGSREWLLQFLEQKMAKMMDTARRKNHDYAGGSSDPFANFTGVEADGTCSTEVGFLVRMRDKYMRIANFVKSGTLMVKDESVDDTLEDLATYSLLMCAYITAKRAAR
jgi:hypothetical protein